MNFELDESQELLRSTVRKFAEKELSLEVTRNGDKFGVYPIELDKKLAALDLYALPFPEEFGGINLGLIELGIVGEELGRCSLDIAISYGLNIVYGLDILRFGNPEQKVEYIPKLIQGEVSFSPFMPEPFAEPNLEDSFPETIFNGETYILGQGHFYSLRNMGNSNIIHLITQNNGGGKGINLFLLPSNAPGIEMKRLGSLGLKILGINEFQVKGVKIPAENLLGEQSKGWEVVKHSMELMRLFTCFAYVGNAQRIVDMATNYAKEREQFGQPIGNFQSVAHTLAKMQVKVEAARLVTYRAAWLKQNGCPCAKEISIARIVSSETLVENAHDGMHIMGGYGYSREYDIERFARGARITTFMNGPTYIHRNIIGEMIGSQL